MCQGILAGSCYAFHVDVSKSVDISIHVHWLEKLGRLARDSSLENAKGPLSNVRQKKKQPSKPFSHRTRGNALVCAIIRFSLMEVNYAENNCLLSERPALLIEV